MLAALPVPTIARAPQTTEGERVVAGIMMDQWAAFAHTGSPNGRGLPSWPRYTDAAVSDDLRALATLPRAAPHSALPRCSAKDHALHDGRSHARDGAAEARVRAVGQREQLLRSAQPVAAAVVCTQHFTAMSIATRAMNAPCCMGRTLTGIRELHRDLIHCAIALAQSDRLALSRCALPELSWRSRHVGDGR